MRKTAFTRIMLVGLAAGFLVAATQARAEDAAQLKQKIQELQDRVDVLETELANKKVMAQKTAPIVPAAPSAPVVPTPFFNQRPDPLTEMMMLHNQMQRNMQQAFANTGMFNPKMDMKSTDKQYIITMDIPGMDKNKINIEVKEGMLSISGERRSESENNKNNQYYRQERSFGTFMQSVPLPADANAGQIDAKYNNGVLTVMVGRMKKGDKPYENQKIKVN